MDTIYNPKEVEAQAQQQWQKKQAFKAVEKFEQEKFYCLPMFPYPSGKLHMGHVRNYTIADVIARYQRALGKNVLQPIGWDAFGLPAENAAIKHGIHPAEWTRKNIESMKQQFLRLGNAYDWSREITTCDPLYYRWEQWFFIKLFEKGLVYRKNAILNWDPVDQTVLANEQVVDGRGWRSGALIERREITQWFLKITAYADELIADLDLLDKWPEQVKQMQRNWIGRSEGLEIHFKVDGFVKRLKIFTTRADTLMGVTYIAVSPDHPLAKEAALTDPAIQAFITSCQTVRTAEADLATMEKRGIRTNFFATHPLSNTQLPIWIANFVVMDYGSGAVMGVPAHDQRDFEFAKKYDLLQQVVIASDPAHDYNQGAFTREGTLIHSGQFDGLQAEEARQTIATHLEAAQVGKRIVHYRIRDWGVSRQRYWGAPIPMIHCENCGIVPVPEADLPVVLPEEIACTGSGSPLAQCSAFVHVDCPKCGREALRETDTFDTFFESSWYYARFACKGQVNSMLDDRAKYWTPVDQYVGGIEHAVMHLLYARFFHKLMRDEGLVNSDEPFTALLTQGMVLKDGHKMSKSKGNIVDPSHLIETYGADTARLFTIFAAPPEASLEWSDAGVDGSHRFLKRLWAFVYQQHEWMIAFNEASEGIPELKQLREVNPNPKVKKARFTLNQILTQISHDYEKQQFNTVVSGCMKLFNALSEYVIEDEDDQCFMHAGLSTLLRLLAPITPHICHHLWACLGFEKMIIDAPWPRIDKSALKKESVDFVVQINGKRRGQFTAAVGTAEETLLTLARQETAAFLEGKTVKRAIVIEPRQLINLVTQ